MAWELLAIWAIVTITITWFVRDERQLRTERLHSRARHFALAPAYRHAAPTFDPASIARPPVLKTTTMAESRRRFLASMQR